MASFNKVFLMGNLTRDPELRYLDSGTAVAKFGLAVNRNFKGRDGAMKEETTFVDVTLWGRQAEVASQHLAKGRPLFVEGRLRLDQWTAQDGTKRSRLEVVGEGFQFIGPRPEGAAVRPVPVPAMAGARNDNGHGGDGASGSTYEEAIAPSTDLGSQMGLAGEEIPF
ncbi:MAG: single-stranded DNA-binding protein [Planctomycetes bacterium]|nr:single-stranded DNA-binding protein [Planctomycetota bacterium]